MNNELDDGSVGIVYLALGRAYLAMAILSFLSLRKIHSDINVTIVTNLKDIKFKAAGLNIVYVDASTKDNRNLKVSISEYVSYSKFIFLDSDTLVLGSLGVAWNILDYFDLGFRLNPYPQLRKGKGDISVLGRRVSDFPHWNSGVMLVKKSLESDLFFKLWSENHSRLGSRFDQVSLVPTIFDSKARVISLEARWNASAPKFWGFSSWRSSTRVFHYASNINDSLARNLIEIDKLIDETSSSEVKNFIRMKRREKRDEFGFFKFMLMKLHWKIVDPVRLDISL